MYLLGNKECGYGTGQEYGNLLGHDSVSFVSFVCLLTTAMMMSAQTPKKTQWQLVCFLLLSIVWLLLSSTVVLYSPNRGCIISLQMHNLVFQQPGLGEYTGVGP